MSKTKTETARELPPYLTTAKTCEVYGLSPSQLKRWITDKRIAVSKPAGERGPTFIARGEIEALMERTRREAKS